MAAGALVAFVVILYLGRHLTTFLYDEWNVFINRRGWDLDTFLEPHNEHLVAAPVAVFKLLFVTVGASPYWPYRVLAALLVVGLGVLVYRFAIPRIGKPAALVPGLLTVLVGAGGHDIIWPFQIALNLSVLGGIVLLLCLDRATPRAEWIAGGFVTLALASSSIGVAVLVAAVVDVLVHPDRPRRALRLLAVPVVLYGLWYAGYNATDFNSNNLLVAPQYAIDAAGGAVGALLGLSAAYYAPAALAFLALVGWGWLRAAPASPRIVTVATLPIAFWLLTGIGRAGDMQPTTSRYLLPGAIFVALVACEALRGMRFPSRAAPLAIVFVAFATWTHVVALRDIARAEFADKTSHVRVEVAALSLAREAGTVNPAFKPDATRAPDIVAGPFFEAVDDIGNPTPDPARTIATSFGDVRPSADLTFFGALAIPVVPAARPRLGGWPPPPALGGAPRRGACTLVVRGREAVFELPPTGLAMRTEGPGRAAVRARRWGATFLDTNGLDPKVWGVYAIGRDRDPTPILVSIGGPASVRVCGLLAP